MATNLTKPNDEIIRCANELALSDFSSILYQLINSLQRRLDFSLGNIGESARGNGSKSFELLE